MKKPSYYKKKAPLPVSAPTIIKTFSAIREAGLEKDFLSQIDDHALVLTPETVNFIKDYVFNNKIHESDGEYSSFAGDVVRSPGGRCP